ncbi:Xaa-Pro peptidase family protein [Aquibacillus sp. 3ASR75-11]|uniref:Xaa-Pro peptidase family protein n=1 Tax=Terrihalobacillus insolitus TaxID=2950438 RepID=A0A9X3WXC0_9BACI|nr:Xaa-Pro peptidase family protein [Terrihalobacillus insolitus]MDC3413788.1 Xaa-Pro peptidase family protein [Terrihalobacillus insolitus]MDC3425956.1 Xaa-Pro peptidase family protein [Terrihalobacillus insolitus]
MKLFKNRLEQCKSAIETKQINSIIVTSKANLQYLLGVELETGERMTALLIAPDQTAKLFIHEMFIEKLGDVDDHDITVIPYPDALNPIDTLTTHLSQTHTLSVDQNWPSHFLIRLMSHCPELSIYASDIVEKLREIKDRQEINALRQSSRIADAVMRQIKQLQRLPTTEKMISENIRDFFDENGVEELAFHPIVGIGKNSANPHHTSSNKNSDPNQPIMLDFGGVYNQYCSDVTRMTYFGRTNLEYEEIYKIVREMQLQALDMIKPGISFSEIDLSIRAGFRKWNYDNYFIHRTGHGIGLEAHEGPFIHQNNHDEVKEGMVLTIEPGLYLPNQFGVRIEDVVMVTNQGCEVLNQCSKDLHYLDVSYA